MKINSAMQFIINKISHLTLRQAEGYLIKNNFYNIGSGCESTVYTRDGFDYVIKLQFDAHYNTSIHHDIPSEKHFMPMHIEKCEYFNVLIQQRVKPIVMTTRTTIQYKKFRKFLKKKFPNVSDIHDGNCGMLNGRMVVFDWCCNN